MNTLDKTNFNLPGQKNLYKGKVRDVYTMNDGQLIMVASDRISAFDVVLPKGIPFKGQVLNQLASKFLDLTNDIVPNWKVATPDPNVTIGAHCDAIKVEMVIRGYLTGHAWRVYNAGGRLLCGVELPEGLKEHDRLPNPIITPSTKATEGHDEDISRDEIIAQGIVEEKDYLKLEMITQALFERGTEYAESRGLILVDTKYEFGKKDDKIFLIDEIHTPDSSRYFYADGYQERQDGGEAQKQLSKEFVREWLMENGFMGQDGQQVPEMTPEIITMISDRYIELYEKLSSDGFEKGDQGNIEQRVEENILEYLKGEG